MYYYDVLISAEKLYQSLVGKSLHHLFLAFVLFTGQEILLLRLLAAGTVCVGLCSIAIMIVIYRRVAIAIAVDH